MGRGTRKNKLWTVLSALLVVALLVMLLPERVALALALDGVAPLARGDHTRYAESWLQPGRGVADVDGSPSEWDLTADFFADLHRDSDPTKQVEAKAYLRYDEGAGVLYVLVVAEPGVLVRTTGSHIPVSYVAVESVTVVDGTSGDNSAPPDFRWLGTGTSLYSGWEASLPLGLADQLLQVRTRVQSGGSNYNAGFAGGGLPIFLVPATEHHDVTGHKYLGATGQVPVAGWTITAERQFRSQWYPVGLTATGADGSFALSDLPRASYRIVEASRPGWEAVSPEAILLEDLDADVAGVEFRNRPATLSISGHKWENQVGAPVAGWSIVLECWQDDAWARVDETATDAQGGYTFDRLTRALYRVVEGAAADWAFVTPAEGFIEVDLTLADESVTGIDFVNRRTAAVTGHKWNDLDGDGEWDVDEAGLEGWSVTLAPTDAGGDATGDAITAVTGADGGYSFDGLYIGSHYRVCEGSGPWAATSYRQTHPDADACYHIQAGLDAAGDYDFGNQLLPPGRLEVTKVVDWRGISPDDSVAFEICIAGPSYPLGDETGACRVVGHEGGAVAWEDLLQGDYAVTETDPGAEWAIDGTGTLSVAIGQTATASVTNARRLGRVDVTVDVERNGVEPVPGQSFEVCLSGPSYPTGDCLAATWDGASLSYGLSWADLLPGEYLVTETDPGSQWLVAGSGQALLVPADGGRADARIVNARRLGRLAVTVAVNWNGDTPDPDRTFSVCIAGPSLPTTDCRTVGYLGGTPAWEGLIPGVYTVSAARPGDEWTVTPESLAASVPANGGQGSATVHFTQLRGSVTITKVVHWNGVVPDQSRSFVVCLIPTAGGATTCRTADYDGGALTWDVLPPGEYAVEEQDPGSEWSVTYSAEKVSVSDGHTATATVTSSHRLGGLRVTQVVKWGDTKVDSGKQFRLCITGPGFATPECRTLGHQGGLLTLEGLVPGVYTVAQDDPGPTWLVSGSGATLDVEAGKTASHTVVSTARQPAAQLGRGVFLPFVRRSTR